MTGRRCCASAAAALALVLLTRPCRGEAHGGAFVVERSSRARRALPVISTNRRWRRTMDTAGLRAINGVQDVLSAASDFYISAPYQAAFVTCGVKAASSDLVAQRVVEKNEGGGFAWKRNLSFVAYGGLYQGAAQYFIFNELYPVLFGSGVDVWTVAVKVLFDQLVLTPFVCLPMAYAVKATVFGYSLPEALERYTADARRDLLWKYWAIWTPTQCITFSVVPVHLRIPFIAAVSFVWLILLSSITSRGDIGADDADGNGPSETVVICYDNECLIVDRLSFVGPSSLINEDGSDRGVRLEPGSDVARAAGNAGPASLVDREDGSSIGVQLPPGALVRDTYETRNSEADQ